MKFIDLHCDTLMVAFLQNQEDICRMPGMLDVSQMKDAGQLAQVFAIFMPPPGGEARMGRDLPDDDEYIEFCFSAYERTMARCGEIIAPAYTAQDILDNEATGKMSGLLSFEDGRAVNGSMEKLAAFYRRGIRMIALTWNQENCFGAPNSVDPSIMSKGLTDFGRDAVSYMQELGMVVDVSHLSDGGFYDVAKICKKPFIASHSNSRSLSPHPRNLTDEMIRILADNGGVSGVNFCPSFLHDDIERKDSTLDGIVAQIHHMMKLGGEDLVALGSDFDGIEGKLEIRRPADMQRIFDRLHRDGLTERVIEKIAYQNIMRVFRDTL